MWWFPILHSGEYGTGHHIGFQRFIIDLYSTDHYNDIVSPIYKESLRKGTVIWIFSCLIWSRISCFQRQCSFKSKSTWWFSHFSCRYDVAFYCLILKRLSRSYPTLFITRKYFFMGYFSFLLFCDLPLNIKLELLKLPVVYLNILFLGVIASMLCYIMWNTAVRASEHQKQPIIFTLSLWSPW